MLAAALSNRQLTPGKVCEGRDLGQVDSDQDR